MSAWKANSEGSMNSGRLYAERKALHEAYSAGEGWKTDCLFGS